MRSNIFMLIKLGFAKEIHNEIYVCEIVKCREYMF